MGIKEEYICDRCCQSSDDPTLPKKKWRYMWFYGSEITICYEALFVKKEAKLLCPDCDKELKEWLKG